MKRLRAALIKIKLRVHSFTTKLKAAPDAYRMPHFTDHRRFSIIESDSLARLAKMKK